MAWKTDVWIFCSHCKCPCTHSGSESHTENRCHLEAACMLKVCFGNSCNVVCIRILLQKGPHLPYVMMSFCKMFLMFHASSPSILKAALFQYLKLSPASEPCKSSLKGLVLHSKLLVLFSYTFQEAYSTSSLTFPHPVLKEPHWQHLSVSVKTHWQHQQVLADQSLKSQRRNNLSLSLYSWPKPPIPNKQCSSYQSNKPSNSGSLANSKMMMMMMTMLLKYLRKDVQPIQAKSQTVWLALIKGIT